MDSKRRSALAFAAAVLLIPSACNGETPRVAESPPPTPSAASPTVDDAPTVSPEAGSLDLPDGRHPAYITELDAAARSVTFDVIQVLTGQEAIDAYRRENPDDPGGPPNDYYIVNSIPRLRTGNLETEAAIRLVKLGEDSDADLDEATLQELTAYLEHREPSTVVFWLTVAGGRITAIEEQYLA